MKYQEANHRSFEERNHEATQFHEFPTQSVTNCYVFALAGEISK